VSSLSASLSLSGVVKVMIKLKESGLRSEEDIMMLVIRRMYTL